MGPVGPIRADPKKTIVSRTCWSRRARSGARYSAMIRSGRASSLSRKSWSRYANTGSASSLREGLMVMRSLLAGEVDEPAFDVGALQFDGHAVPHVQSLESADDASLDRGLQ